VETPADGSLSLFNEAGVIIADTTCRRCGYNLRGLSRDGRCPECGTPIGLSTHGDLLRSSGPELGDSDRSGAQRPPGGSIDPP
jgi:ribosomal protein S27AE